MKNLKKTLCFFLLTMGSVYAQSNCGLNTAVKTNFYNGSIPTNFVVLKPTGVENGKDSQNLKNKITNNQGKLIYLKSGTSGNTFYLRDIKILSNTHIRVAKNVVLKTRRDDLSVGANSSMFIVGMTGARVYNFTISSIGDEDDKNERFTVQMRQLKNSLVKINNPSTSVDDVTAQNELSGDSFIRIANAENFKLSNFNIKDNYSRISSMTFSLNDKKEKNHFKSVLSTSKYPEKDRTPTKGYIKNITGTKSHVGYGLVQIQAGERMLFENLSGTGGVPLRVETGLVDVMVTPDRTVDGIYGLNIKSINGLSAVDIAPHNVDQGCVDMKNISSVGSMFTIRLDKGYPAGDDKDIRVENINDVLMANTSTNFYDDVQDHDFSKTSGGPKYVKISDVNTYNGTFKNVKLKNISGKGGNSAQLKTKFLQFYDTVKNEKLKDKITDGDLNDDMESVSTKSLGIIKYTSDPTLDECNCNGTTPASNGCFSAKIAKSNNNYVVLKRNESTSLSKIINKGGFYGLPTTPPSSAITYPGYTNSQRPKVISGKANDQLSGNKIATACDALSTSTQELKKINRDDFSLSNLTVYPNPSSGLINIETSEKSFLSIYDSVGNLVKRVVLNQGLNSIDLSSQKSGVYFFNIKKKDGFLVKKVLLSK